MGSKIIVLSGGSSRLQLRACALSVFRNFELFASEQTEAKHGDGSKMTS